MIYWSPRTLAFCAARVSASRRRRRQAAFLPLEARPATPRRPAGHHGENYDISASISNHFAARLLASFAAQTGIFFDSSRIFRRNCAYTLRRRILAAASMTNRGARAGDECLQAFNGLSCLRHARARELPRPSRAPHA